MRLLSHQTRQDAEHFDAMVNTALVVAAAAVCASFGVAVALYGVWVLQPVLALIALSLAFTRLTRGFVAALCLVAAGWLLHG